MEGLIDITDDEFRHISQLVYEKFGIHLTEKKRVLVRGRLNKLLRQMGYNNFEEYYHAILEDPSGAGLLELVDRISTNHTYFYREKDHFDFLEKRVLPDIGRQLDEQRSKDLRLWCAGCATGEEAYTLAIVLAEFFGPHYFSDGPPILATDISRTALEKAMLGAYGKERIDQIPKGLLHKYFVLNDMGGYSVKDELKKLVLFKRLNFKRETFPFRKKFHTVFCRNVMIYFDQPTKETLVNKFGGVLNEGGYLFIGHSETLGRDNMNFQYVQPAVYVKKAKI
ncbi:MAG: CheR family methyltransferase [bacterium]